MGYLQTIGRILWIRAQWKKMTEQRHGRGIQPGVASSILRIIATVNPWRLLWAFEWVWSHHWQNDVHCACTHSKILKWYWRNLRNTIYKYAILGACRWCTCRCWSFGIYYSFMFLDKPPTLTPPTNNTLKPFKIVEFSISNVFSFSDCICVQLCNAYICQLLAQRFEIRHIKNHSIVSAGR